MSLISEADSSVTVALVIVLSSSVVLQPALNVRLVRMFVIVRSVALTSDVQGRPFASAVLSSQPANSPKPVGHFLISNFVTLPVLPPSVVRTARTSQDMPPLIFSSSPTFSVVSKSSPPTAANSTNFDTFVPLSFQTAARASAGTARATRATIAAAINKRLLPFISPIPLSCSEQARELTFGQSGRL